MILKSPLLRDRKGKGLLFVVLFLACHVAAVLNATEDSLQLVLSNDRLFAAVNKSTGAIDKLSLDGQDLLGTLNYVTPTPGGATGSGNSGIGPYLDCYCIPSGSYTPGSIAPKYQLISGIDSTKTSYGGILMSETYPPTGQTLEQYWFLRDGETGLHTFSRLTYHNISTPFLRNLQEFRTLFRPNTPLWTHLLTNKNQYAPLPSKNATSHEVVVQDATWYLGNTPNDPYVQQEADYFTKYTFQDTWRDHDVHGMYADGSASDDGSTFGSCNTTTSTKALPQQPWKNFASTPSNFTPPPGTPLSTTPSRPHVPGYVPSSNRTTWKAHIDLPSGVKNPIAVLAQNGVDFQDNVQDVTAYQYWADIDPDTGDVTIPSVKAGVYRLTVYGEGIFGQYTQDDIVITPNQPQTTPTYAKWEEESSGIEIWRIGIPDKSSGEYLHGYAPSTTHPLRPSQYRIYWAIYDFPTDFPFGVTFEVGKSDFSKDMNYVHWSVFGGQANSLRTVPYTRDVNNWTIVWEMDASQLTGGEGNGGGKEGGKGQATFTVQLAGAKTAAGNTDIFNASEPFANLPYTVVVNGRELEPWVIPYYHSSSCAVRSAVICYNIANKFVFDADFLVVGKNEIILSLPANATDYESAVLPQTTYVQYDALRLEIG
ncbi:hypothetical protein G7Y89_g7867 [Cudoniella acicularis]|uniref:Rhamnogalacturonan endolyase n=1 Tax=Cudoniella acicularis TaxID=354080 RepID=A0A8H4RHP9_9HELO|nr:hypothetical protein G7Y89_g7867 [Cudoniella acicularis]